MPFRPHLLSLKKQFIVLILFCITSGVGVYVYNLSIFSRQMIPTTGVYRNVFHYVKVSSSNFTYEMAPSQHWQQVGTTNDLYVFSAYYYGEENIVVVIGVAFPKTKVNVICVLHSKNNQIQSKVHGTLELLPEHHDRGTCAFFIRCPLDRKIKPVTVGLMVGNVTTYLQVIYASPRKYNFTVCIACLHGPYRDPFTIIEMVEADLIFGADHFIVYNHSISPEVDRVLWHYVQKGKMEVIKWNLPEVDVWYWGQMVSLQDCNFASRHKSKYLVQKDVDELIVPHKHKNWHELMGELDKEGSKNATYMFRNTYFRLDWPADIDEFKGGASAKSLNLKSLLHVNRENYFFNAKVRTKSIVHPERVIISGIHFPWKTVNGSSEADVDTKIAFLHHYREWSGYTAKVKDEHMRQFADQLINNVNRTLFEVGLR